MVERVQRFIEQWNMIEPADTVIVGVSGGADSVCLCLVLKELSVCMGFRLRAVHVEHGIRGSASRSDAVFVKELCAQLGISFAMHEEDVPAFAREHHMSIEEAARVLRYRAFEREAEAAAGSRKARDIAGEREAGAGRIRIALAHHMEDNAETMLLQLVRGTGLDGLCGMQPVRAGEGGAVYVRPLLGTSRREIEEFLEERKQAYCRDATNDELEYSRNRIRHRVMPELTEINAQAVLHMNQAAGRLMQLRSYIDGETERAYTKALDIRMSCADTKTSADTTMSADMKIGTGTENAVQHAGKNGWYLRKDVLTALPHVLLQRVLQRAVAEAAGARKDIAAVHIQALQGLLGAQTGRRIDLPYGLAARREYEYIVLWKKCSTDGGKLTGTGSVESVQCAARLQGARKTVVTAEMLADCAEHGARITVPCGDTGAQMELCAFSYEGNPLKISSKMYTKWFDYDKIKDGFSIRTREKGDYFVLDEAGHHKKLERYFIDRKLPQSERESFLILARGQEVLWAVGGRMGRSGMVTESTRTILEVVYKGGVENGLQ